MGNFIKTIMTIVIFMHITIMSIAQTDTNLNLSITSRALPNPLKSPPFPGGDWLNGPIIGEPADALDYALQKLLGMANNKSRIKIYGWIDPSYSYSTSKNCNVPVAYNVIPNAFELDQ